MALKILIVGSESLDFVAELLREEGLIVSRVYARKRSLYLDVVPKFDIVYGEYLMNGARVAKISKLLRKRFVLHIIGTDALRYATEKFSWRWFTWLSGLAMTSKILYAAENLQRLVGFRGTILPLPVNTRLFKKRDWAGEMRDILYYSPNDDPTYRPDWIVQYALNNPKEKITVLGDLGQRIIPVNIRTIPAIRQRHAGNLLLTQETHPNDHTRRNAENDL
jgi:hypothetical protein